MLRNKTLISKISKVMPFVVTAIASLVVLIQRFDFQAYLNMSSHVSLRYLPTNAKTLTFVLAMIVFGAVYGRKDIKYGEAVKYWIVTEFCLLFFYPFYMYQQGKNFRMWSMFGIVFPILTGTSSIFSAVIISIILQPIIKKSMDKVTIRQSFTVLVTLTLFSFISSAGMFDVTNTLTSVYLVLYFAWGMLLSRFSFTLKKKLVAVLVAVASFTLINEGGVLGPQLYQQVQTNWNPLLFSSLTSPLILTVSASIFAIFEKYIKELKPVLLQIMLTSAVCWQSPIFGNIFQPISFTHSITINRLLIAVILEGVIWGLSYLFVYLTSKSKGISQIIDGFDQPSSFTNFVEYFWAKVGSFIQKHRVVLCTWVWFYLLSWASIFIVSNKGKINFGFGQTPDVLIYFLSHQFFTIIFTTLFIYALFNIAYFIVRRYWTSNILTSIIVIAWSVANRIKLTYRGEPIYPADFNELVNWNSLAHMLDKQIWIYALIVVIVLSFALIVLERKTNLDYSVGFKRSFIWLILSVCLFITPRWFNHEGTFIYNANLAFDNGDYGFHNPVTGLQTSGPILNILDFIDINAMKEPENYSESSIEKISNKYQKVANNINAERKMNVSDQTVIFNLSESFIDPYMAPGVKIKGHDPIPFIRSMQNRSTYGKMLSTGYGGDTANMEFQGLTGFTLGLMSIPTLVAYTQVVPYHPFFPTIGMNFKYKSAIHPFDGTFYSRIEDYQRFSFNKFAYFGSKYKIYDQKKIDDNPNDSDFTLYYNALHQIDSRKGGQFISLLSIQNHMPYNNWYKHNEYKGKVFGKYLDNDEVRTSFATYVKGTEYTDKAVKKFINHIDNIDKPITIVFYGDHYPGILNSDLIYKYPIRLHSTRYFIYSNKYAREHGAKTKLDTNYNYVNTSEFIPMMLEQTDSKVTAYQALLTEVHKKLPAITINYDGGKGFELIDHETGKKVDQKTLTPEQKELLHDYELVQYDMNVGKSYALKNTNFYGKLK